MALCENYGYTPNECMGFTLYQVRALLDGPKRAGQRAKYAAANPRVRKMIRDLEGFNA